MHFPTCCLAIMGSMTSAICLDNLFHLSSFSLWHCCSTRMNISNTYNTCVKANVRQRKDWLKYFVTLACRVCANLWPYLMVLHKSEQHGDHHFFLSIKLLACICFVWAPQHKEVVDYWLQGWDGCGGRRKAKLNYFDSITNVCYYASVDQCPSQRQALENKHAGFPATIRTGLWGYVLLWSKV